MDKTPSYYAIIPAEVRYSDLKPNAKLLYGEITALSNKKGYCFATNRYFAELYGVTKNTISLWVKNLCDYGFIKLVIERDENKQIVKRMLSIIKNSDRTIIKKDEVISTSINTTSNLSIRRIKFEEKVFESNCTTELCSEFIMYWTETNKTETKMRFEMEKTFDIKRRLKRWKDNNEKWNKPKIYTKSKSESKTKQSVKTWENARNLLKNLKS